MLSKIMIHLASPEAFYAADAAITESIVKANALKVRKLIGN